MAERGAAAPAVRAANRTGGPALSIEADIRRQVHGLAKRGDHASMIRLLSGALLKLGCPADLSIALLDALRAAGDVAAIGRTARRLARHSPEPDRIAREAARRLPLDSPEAQGLLRLASLVAPGDPTAIAGLVLCLDARGDQGTALRYSRRHEAASGERGTLLRRMAYETWQGQRWRAAVPWFERLADTVPRNLIIRSYLQNAVEKSSRDMVFPGAYPIAGLADRLLPAGDRTSVLFVGARGENLDIRFRGIPANRLEVIGVDPELAKASDPASTGIAVRYLRDALSDREEERTFYETSSGGGSSLFRPSPSAARYMSPVGRSWGEMLEVAAEHRMRTTSVDAIRARGDLGRVDALYVNIQGGELAVLEGGREAFADTVAVQVETSFISHYEGAPDWRAVDRELLAQGFVLVDVRNLMTAGRTKVGFRAHPDNRLGYDRWPSWQLAEAHLLYLRDPVEPANRGVRLFRRTRDWLVFALWAEYYGQVEIALEALMTLVDEPGIVDDPEQVAGIAGAIGPITERYRSYLRVLYP
ncbi:hypothetical protein GCM10017083_38110 [Thalassobaculum fulvum]|uniref:Methyltransferase FkbM domain-containing protein n=1 Tax=Thalassobaculum fulvum TaxID=1633335 RepID=A0A919CQW0_9PROT|nr:hypothetical protein GCM10017083_38110 [Thalassobaculum fulvum]